MPTMKPQKPHNNLREEQVRQHKQGSTPTSVEKREHKTTSTTNGR